VRRTTPAGHGEVLTEPDRQQWAALARANAAASAAWDFSVAGLHVQDLRRLARSEAIERARAFSARLGVPVAQVVDVPDLLVMAGHQPELYHPGVWIKVFLLQQLGEETGAAALDLVVDTDGFDVLELHSPCLKPDVYVCRAYLAVGTADGCYGCASVPTVSGIEDFCAAGAEHLGTLPAPALAHHFARFCVALRSASGDADNLAELVTFARRRYEAAAGSDYLELMVSSLAASRAFLAFAAHIALDALSFSAAYNAALADYRERTGTRSAAQPFPDLAVDGALVELPLWEIRDSGRTPVWARTGESPALVVDGEVVCELVGGPSVALDRLTRSGLRLAPKALALTLFTRMFVADFFIHGVGGGRYDQVTDDVIRRYFGVEPPRHAVASMTMYLPLGAHVVRDDEVDSLSMALNRLRQNPDQMLGEVEFDTSSEREAANALAARKAALVAAIAAPGADKKSIGLEIRQVNAELAQLLAPIESEMRVELEQLEQMRAASEIFTDRTYPFCLWDPCEIADKVR